MTASDSCTPVAPVPSDMQCPVKYSLTLYASPYALESLLTLRCSGSLSLSAGQLCTGCTRTHSS